MQDTKLRLSKEDGLSTVSSDQVYTEIFQAIAKNTIDTLLELGTTTSRPDKIGAKQEVEDGKLKTDQISNQGVYNDSSELFYLDIQQELL